MGATMMRSHAAVDAAFTTNGAAPMVPVLAHNTCVPDMAESFSSSNT